MKPTPTPEMEAAWQWLLLENGHRVRIAPQMQRDFPIRPHLRDLGRDPAHVAFGGFSIRHAEYLGRRGEEAR